MELSGNIIELAGGVLIVLFFFIFVKIFGLVEKSTRVITIAKSSIAILQNAELDDYEKEIAMQKHAKTLFFLFFLITFGSIIALAIPFGLIWLMEYAELLSVDKVIQTTLTIEFIVVTLILSLFFFLFTRKKNEKTL